jgi:hypothetical protein
VTLEKKEIPYYGPAQIGGRVVSWASGQRVLNATRPSTRARGWHGPLQRFTSPEQARAAHTSTRVFASVYRGTPGPVDIDVATLR